jgi:hypothetical protein
MAPFLSAFFGRRGGRVHFDDRRPAIQRFREYPSRCFACTLLDSDHRMVHLAFKGAILRFTFGVGGRHTVSRRVH